MTDSCRDIAPLLTEVAESQHGPSPDSAAGRHLAACPACQHSLRVQRDMHGLLRARADNLQGRAPEALRARLVAQAAHRVPTRRWAPFRMPVAATALLALLGAVTYGLTGASSTVLAAQLALDHLKCIRLVGSATTVTPSQAAQEWGEQYAWTPQIPASPDKASLIGVRRCLYAHGHLAHLLYDVGGRTVSVFVMPRSEYPTDVAPARHQFLGQQAEVWASGDQSFAVVGDVAPQQLAALAAQFRGE